MPDMYSELPNKLVSAANGIDYAYRDTGDGAVPLVLLQHFRGNLDNWDPALIDALASTRRVVTFDNVGVGGSTGTTPNAIQQMAHDAITFVTALELGQVDILGFSIGSFIAQEIALARPASVLFPDDVGTSMVCVVGSARAESVQGPIEPSVFRMRHCSQLTRMRFVPSHRG